MQKLQREIEQILGVYYVSPHVSPDGVTFKEGVAELWICYSLP
jgi:hypothetical protein